MIVQLHDVQAPEEPAAARGLEVREKLFQDGVALVLELVVQSEEGRVDRIIWDSSNGAFVCVNRMRPANPICNIFAPVQPKSCATAAAENMTSQTAFFFTRRVESVLSLRQKRLRLLKNRLFDDGRVCFFCVILRPLSMVFKFTVGQAVRSIAFLPEGITNIFFVSQNAAYSLEGPSAR